MTIAIAVENLSKKYIIGHKPRQHYMTLRDVIAEGVKNAAHKLVNPFASSDSGLTYEEFWALKDISFEVEQGDRVGIIGRNGAGKSTLLKILSRVTEPTSGRISIRGRVASLLEVGTGFHPELTGRENIFLNGAILGMSKAEIARKFEEIVAFAEVEQFLDTPVKRYSSGMYVRLAFAVAAHLEPDILIVDEVLAVGDAQFQRKCLGKMRSVADSGRTVVYVSHNLNSLTDLCNRGVWVQTGRVNSMGTVDLVVKEYLASGMSASGGIVEFVSPSEHKEAYISSVALRDKLGSISVMFDVEDSIEVEVKFKVRRRFSSWRIFASVTRMDGITVFSTTTWDYIDFRPAVDPGGYAARLKIPGRLLAENTYFLTVAFGEPPTQRHDVHENFMSFQITGQPFEYNRNIGVLAYPFEWDLKKAD
jgi:lipopolysaccharide transport system ATP-binding protein